MSEGVTKQRSGIDPDLLEAVEAMEYNSSAAFNAFQNRQQEPQEAKKEPLQRAYQQNGQPGYQPSYRYSDFRAASTSGKNNAVGLILSLIAFFFGLIPFVSIPVGIIGLVFSLKSKDPNGKIDGKGILGIIFSVIALLFALVITLALIVS